MPPKRKDCFPTGKNVKAYGEMVKPNSMNAPTPKSIKKRPIDKSANPPTKKSLQLVQDSEKLIQSSSIAIANKINFFQERIKAVDNLLKIEQSASAKAKLKEIKMALEQELEKLIVAQQQGITEEPALFGDIPAPPIESIDKPRIPELMDAPIDDPLLLDQPLKPDDPEKYERAEFIDPFLTAPEGTRRGRPSSKLSSFETDEAVLERILRERFGQQQPPPPAIPDEWKDEPMNTIADLEEVVEQQGQSLNNEDLKEYIESQDKPIKDLTADDLTQFVEPKPEEEPPKYKIPAPKLKPEEQRKKDRIEVLEYLIENTEFLKENAKDKSQIKSLDDSLDEYKQELAELQSKKESKKGKEKAKSSVPPPKIEISEEQKKMEEAYSKMMSGEISQEEYQKILEGIEGTAEQINSPKKDTPRKAFKPAEGSEYFDNTINMSKNITIANMKLFDDTIKAKKRLQGDKVKGLVADILDNMGIQQMEVGEKGLSPLEFENLIYKNKTPFKEVRWNVKYFRPDVKDLVLARQAEPEAMANMLKKWKERRNYDNKANATIDRLAVLIWSGIVQDTDKSKILMPFIF
jgi:hypothetical protein